MEKQRRRQKRTAHLMAAAVFCVFILAAGIWLLDRYTPTKRRMDPAEYFPAAGGEAAVVIDGRIMEERARVFDGEICPDAGSVQNYLNPAVFYDEAEEKLIVTTPEEKLVYPVSGGVTAGGEARIAGDQAYISLDFLGGISDFAVHFEEAPLRAVIVTDPEYPAMDVKEDAPVRFRAGIKSPVLTDLSGGDEVRVTDVSAEGESLPDKVEGWTHVITEDGYTGYVRDRHLENPHTGSAGIVPRRGAYTPNHLDEPVNMVFHQTTSAASNEGLTGLIREMSGVNVIAPTWFFLQGPDGGVSSIADAEYVEEAHEAGLSVWAVFNDFDGAAQDGEMTREALSSDTKRSGIVKRVTEELRSCGADGLNLDFEYVREECAREYLQLIREFSLELKKAGLILSVDNFVPRYTRYMDRKEQGRVVDYVVVMCYDEHTAGSSEAGSVSSVSFVREGIADTISEVPRDKVIAAIPFYTRLWRTSGENVESTAYGMEETDHAVRAAGMEPVWDEECGQFYAEQQTGDVLLQIWIEDSRSIALKMDAVRESGCAGVAEWKLGLETPDIWGVIQEKLNGEA